jgi:hypothetical protein
MAKIDRTPIVTSDTNETGDEQAGRSGKKEVPKEVSVVDLLTAMFAGFGDSQTEQGKKDFKRIFTEYLKQVVAKYPCADRYNILILHDDSSLVKNDADNIYKAVGSFIEKKPLLLILYSRGGSAASAYLIGKLCLEYCNQHFTVVVPRFAKSAATLLCCAANEIHMGSLSELGPIDPQIDGLPALGLKHAIEHLAELVKSSPESAEMLAKYMHLSIPPINLGYYERVVSSAAQYAENLLVTHSNELSKGPKEIAHTLVYKYKDHGFVIDKAEAMKIFGSKVIKTNTDVYELGNAVYEALSMTKNFLDSVKHNFYLIGSLDSEPSIRRRN